MDIKYQDIITLSDNNEYVVASKVNYQGSDYIYLVDINNTSNLKFIEIEKEGYLSELDKEKDKDLIEALIPLFYNNSKKDVEYMPE